MGRQSHTTVRPGGLVKHVHLYGNKWVTVKPVKLGQKYFVGELDNKDREYTEKITYFHEIVFVSESIEE
jgi:hypothetical protein